MAMGYDILSMSANSILPVKKTIRSLRFEDSVNLLDEVLKLDNSLQIIARLNQVLSENGLESFIHQ